MAIAYIVHSPVPAQLHQAYTMPYQHLSTPYESSVTDRHKIWLDKHDIARRLEKRDSFNSSYFLDGKKGNWTELEPGDHTPIFMAKKIVEGAQSKLCRLIGCAEVLVGYSSTKS